MQKDYTKDPWWNCLTSAEREAISKEMEEEEPTETSGENCPSKKAHWKARDLFGWG